MHANGWGVVKDDVEAGKWHRKAADKGDADAQFRLGNMHDNGKGVAKDDVEAVSLYLKAALQDHALAQHDLGIMHAKGEGVPVKDSVEAYAWFIVAASSSDSTRPEYQGFDLSKTRDSYGRTLTPEAKLKAQARARVLRSLIEENIKAPKK